MGGMLSYQKAPSPTPGMKYVQDRPHQQPSRPPPPRQRSVEFPTEKLIDGLETQLSSMTNTLRSMKGRNPPEAREELVKMMSETERDLQRLNRKINPYEDHAGKSTFYRSLSQGSEEDGTLVSDLIAENDNLRQKYRALQRKNENLSVLLKEEKARADKEEEKNTDLLLRLSKVAGQRLVDNNPAIADLSDPSRPTKLGEIYSEIYDNEWTEAFEGLQREGNDEVYAIVTLYLTLINVFDFCKKKAETMLLKTEDAVNFLFEEYKLTQETKKVARFMTMPRRRVTGLKVPYETIENLHKDIVLHERWRLQSGNRGNNATGTIKVERSDEVLSHIRALRKETAQSMVPIVQKAYLKATWTDGELVPALKPYIRKCIFLCWMMAVQSPAMSLHIIDEEKDVKFDKNLYKEYTVSGPMMKFVVWPALMLHDDGPLVCKGVAQGCIHS